MRADDGMDCLDWVTNIPISMVMHRRLGESGMRGLQSSQASAEIL